MSSAPYVVGHDVGTSGDKAVLCDSTGKIVATTNERYQLRHPHPTWAEQDPADLVSAVGRATSRLLEDTDIPASDVTAIALSGQMFCVGAVDASGHSISPLISWLDIRSKDKARAITRLVADEQYQRFGSVITAKDIVPKIRWLIDEAPDVARGAAAFLDCKELVGARLTGRIATDHAGASAYLLYDLDRHAWNESAAADLDIPLAQLPPVVDATAQLGGLTAAAASDCRLAAGTPVIVCAGDVAAGQVGAGAARPGQAHLSLGTASYFGTSLDRSLADPGRRLGLLGHVDPDRRVLWAEMETGAGALAWWQRAARIGNEAGVDELVASTKPTDHVPIFAPWLTGERVPYWDDDARAAFVGLDYRDGLAELTRAVIEGICFQLGLVFDYGAAFGAVPDEIRVVGGAGLGSALPQVLADVLERKLLLVDEPRLAGARGAAFCALAATADVTVDELSDAVGIGRVVTPRDGREPYADRFGQFSRLHDALAGVLG